MEHLELANRIAKTLYDKKAVDIVVLSVAHLTVIADYMVIATGRSSISVKALANEVEDQLSASHIKPRRSEGHNEGRWIVIDYGSVIVHVFHQEERSYYNLERLWEDGTNRVPQPFAQDDL